MSNAAVTQYLREEISKRTAVPLDEVRAESVLVDLGLESIDAVLLCGDAEDHFGIEIDPSSIFEHDTLGSFAKEIDTLIAAK